MSSVLLLGAMSDIGKDLAMKYAEMGSHVWLAGRNMDDLNLLKNDIQIRTQNSSVKTFKFDALAFAEHESFYMNLPANPDVVIAIFGLLGDNSSAVTNWKESENIINTNYTGAVSILNIAAEQMAARGSGSIVGISSVAGDRGRQSNYIYGSAKAAFTAYLSGLRNAMYHKGVHVLTVKPGFVATQMTEHLDLPGPLTAQPAEVAAKVIRAIEKKKNVIYVKWMWRYIMLIITLIPEFIFKKLKM